MDKILSASKCGFPCQRNLFYSVNGYEGSTSNKSQRIFDVGTALEPVIVEWLRSDGWTVEYNQGSKNAPIEVSIDVVGGKLIGHPDCIISRPDGLQNVLIDIKTMNERAFTQWKREGSLKSKPQYVKQLHVYALGLISQGRTIEKLGIVGVNKNNSELHIDFFDFDPQLAQSIKDMAQQVFALKDAPSDNCPAERWCCSYCDYSGICELMKKPAPKQEVCDEVNTTYSEEIIAAFSDLYASRSIAKHAKELEKNAKEVIGPYFSQRGVKVLKGGGYICSVSVRRGTSFDNAEFKKAHPDLLNKFTKTSTSTVFDIEEV